jgi:hypothetical protein
MVIWCLFCHNVVIKYRDPSEDNTKITKVKNTFWIRRTDQPIPSYLLITSIRPILSFLKRFFIFKKSRSRRITYLLIKIRYYFHFLLVKFPFSKIYKPTIL